MNESVHGLVRSKPPGVQRIYAPRPKPKVATPGAPPRVGPPITFLPGVARGPITRDGKKP